MYMIWQNSAETGWHSDKEINLRQCVKYCLEILTVLIASYTAKALPVSFRVPMYIGKEPAKTAPPKVDSNFISEH